MWLNRKHMSIDEAIKAILHRKRITKEKVRMVSNPYNPLVIRIDFIDNSVSPPNIKSWWAEKLTQKTEEKLISFADEIIHGRYW